MAGVLPETRINVSWPGVAAGRHAPAGKSGKTGRRVMNGDGMQGDGVVGLPAAGIPAERHEAFEIVAGESRSGVLVLCDHASNRIPPEYGNLGLPPGELERHIAWDIGAEGVARRLAARLGAPAVISRFSRLLVDPNRGLDDPTILMRISDGAIVPGNAAADAQEKRRRLERFYLPYDAAISRTIERFRALGVNPALVSVHSFTPVWRGVRRPWHAGLLYDPRDPEFSVRLMEALAATAPDLVIGDNQPYRGGLSGDTMDRHGFVKGLPHALVEIRQDLIQDAAGQELWAQRLELATRAALDAIGGVQEYRMPEAAGDSHKAAGT